MKTLVKWLATIVRKAPALAIIVVLALTAVFGVFAPQLEQTTGIEVFVPDNPELRALMTLEEQFGSAETTVQILIESETGDVITAEGVQVALSVEQTIRTMEPAVPLANRDDGPIVSYLTPTLQMVQFMGLPVSSLTDANVKTMFSGSLSQVPTDQRSLFEGLLSTVSTDFSAAATGTGLMVIFLRQGIRKTSVDDVAEQAGVTRVTVYRHFADREELVGAAFRLVNDAFDRIREALEEEVDLDGYLARMAIEFTSVPLGFMSGMAELETLYPKIHGELRKGRRQLLRAIFDELYGRAKQEGRLRPGLDKDVVEALFWEVVMTLPESTALSSRGLSTEEIYTTLSGLLLYGLLKE